MPRMSEASPPPRVTTLVSPLTRPGENGGYEKVVCERCSGANVYRMHAVWRCADCGFKTDCCGW
jgi:ribosomal protein L37AE/L43A